MSASEEGVRRHPAEPDRLDSLASYGVLDSAPDPAFDALASLAAQVCDTPLAAVSFVATDRQWFKATHGIDATETPRDIAFCSHVVADGRTLVVPDLTEDERFRTNPLVGGDGVLRAYAGVPLIGRDGLPLGALCVLDHQAREFSAPQLATLTGLAGQAVALLEQGRRDLAQGLLAEQVLGEARDPVRLRQALEAGELVPHFQPLVDIHTGTAYGVEALLRWQHPGLGLLPPSAFLPAVEASALVVPVGRAVLDAALAQVARLHRDAVPLPGGVGVNVAGGQLARPGLAKDVLTALERHGVPAGQLALEITEATALPDAALARTELAALVDAGVHVVIDDFGTGWSNLARVLELPVSAIKLDRGLAGAVLRDQRAAAMVRSTLRLARELELHVVAEGVETEDVRAHLAQEGCLWAQGWLFSPAVPGAALPGVLQRLAAGPLPHPRDGDDQPQPTAGRSALLPGVAAT